MNTKTIKLAGALLLGFLINTAVSAQSQRYTSLDLTEEQQTEITTLSTAHYKAITPLKNKMAELKARERTLLSEENVDMKALNKTIDEQTDLTNKMRKLQVEQQVAVKSLLTDEQVMKMQQRRQFARHDGFHGKRGHRGDRGHGYSRGHRYSGDRGTAVGRGMGRGYRGI